MRRIPEHIRWPGMVIAILGLSLTANVIFIISANSDGGAQVEPEYYSRAVDWDANSEKIRKSRALGWKTTLEMGADEHGKSRLRIRVIDRAGIPVTGLQGSVASSHVALSKETVSAWSTEPGSPGVYTTPVDLFRAGLWDFKILLMQGPHVEYTATIRMEFEDRS